MFVELGDEVECCLTGIIGVVYTKAVWLNNCNRLVIQPRVSKDSVTKPEAVHCDEPLVKIINKGVVKGNKFQGDNGRVKLGDAVRDTVTGLSGTCVVVQSFLRGSVNIGIQPKIDKKQPNKKPDIESFDEQQVEVLKKKDKASKEKDTFGNTGGPATLPSKPF